VNQIINDIPLFEDSIKDVAFVVFEGPISLGQYVSHSVRSSKAFRIKNKLRLACYSY